MLKIYLDQKDYSNIARGLNGEKNFELYVNIYDQLKSLLSQKSIKIYFSWTHIIESLRYYDLNSELWNIHCETIDILTEGNCIIFPKRMRLIELEIFLSETFGFKHHYDKANYPYGKYKDAVDLNNQLFTFDMEKKFKENVKKNKNMTRNERRQYYKKLTDKDRIKDYFNSLSDDELSKFLSGKDGSPVTKVMFSYFDREKCIDFVIGSKRKKSEIFSELLDKIFQFRNLVSICGPEFYELQNAAIFPGKIFEKIDSLLKVTLSLQSIGSRPVLDMKKLSKDVLDKSIQVMKTDMKKFAKKHNFSIKEAERALANSSLEPIKGGYLYVFIVVEYLKRHVAFQRARNPKESDIMDLYNIMNIPYVDLYLTDNFFAGIAKSKINKLFGTKIFKNLQELSDFLMMKPLPLM